MTDILQIIYFIPGTIIAFVFHEFAHAYVADKLGDKTPRFQGRLTLNPLAHIDIIGFLSVLIFNFGWAKPVQTNPNAYKKYYKDDLKVSIAGPIMNFICAIVCAIMLRFLLSSVGILPELVTGVLIKCLINAVMININIGLFNLLPVPGLDGFHILRDISPKTFYKYEVKFSQYQGLIMIGLILIGGKIISYPSQIIVNLIKYNIIPPII